ncbi:expressed unknown protein [Seminavis robusta]|uniref:Uncharacterized protein n=1 Tax=Seminavis robusta TaxID=568900 RepID=A0A9N8HJA0_9STRA|nr:expressed unknown protein [Seminavis robusta]|eukprot:Sro846_g210091.1  (416) ;mRNA; r:3201-4448
MEIWAASDTQPITHPIIDKKAPVQVNTATHFPYLDLDLYWQNQQNLQFKVHLKPNQQLLYLNKGSSHTSTCFDSIPRGVCHRLAKLTTVTEDNADTSLQDLYPDHFAALKHANLINKHTMPKIPTLREANHIFKPKSPTNRQLQQKKRDARRTTYFCIGYSKAWTTPIWKVIQNLIQNKYPTLKWIRPAMSYHRFTNLREIFNGDIMTKLNTGIVSLDFTTRPCNCTNRLTDGCAYNNHCRKPIVIYEATSTQPPNTASSPKSYIGATQNFLKLRMSSHVSETKRLCQFLRGKKHKPKNSDTFAWHFAAKAVATTTGDPTASDIRKLYNLKILWQGNPLSTVKTFGTNDCILCNQERLHIFKRMRNKPSTLLNRCEELFNTCRHKPRFHRFTHATPVSSTDEPSMGEKVPTTIDV